MIMNMISRHNSKTCLQVLNLVFIVLAFCLLYQIGLQNDSKIHFSDFLIAIVLFFPAIVILSFTFVYYQPPKHRDFILKIYDLIWVFLGIMPVAIKLANFPMTIIEKEFVFDQNQIQVEIGSIRNIVNEIRQKNCHKTFAEYKIGDFCFDALRFHNMLSNGFHWSEEEKKYIYPTGIDWNDFDKFVKHDEVGYDNANKIVLSLEYIQKIDQFWNHSIAIDVRDNPEQIGFFLYCLIYIGAAVRLSKAIADVLISRSEYRKSRG